ncbi:TMEM175 family protein [Zwartia panacis]|uniref:TMEM175 family protein n=1 Tax=Zwartia panacis TaxID=2683345 RepID=UPI0025B325B0|nr:TMEM175 family protein [Zwartia panacis]MDN4017836.1 TMEM175 family protein [Zwartia panacis]
MASEVSKQRLEALSDGIYAVALTILVLDLKLPSQSFGGDEGAFLNALEGLLPNLLTWLLSFWVLSIYWLAQVKLYRLTKDVDHAMVRFAFGELALISLLPFSTSLIGEHGDHVAAAAIYSLNLVGISALSLLRTTHVLNRTELHENQILSSYKVALSIGVWTRLWCASATFALAFFYPGWNMLAMLLPTILVPFLLKRRRLT